MEASWRVTVTLTFSFALAAATKFVSEDTVKMVANMVTVAGDYFSTNCIYFLSTPRVEDMLMVQKLTKVVSVNSEKSFALSNLAEYRNVLLKYDQDRCHVSLRVILRLEDVNKNRESLNNIFRYRLRKITSGGWLVFSESFDDKYIANAFQGVDLPFDIELLVAWVDGPLVHLKEVYQMGSKRPLKQSYFGNWSTSEGLFSPQKSKYSRRSNLEGVRMKVAFVENNAPYTKLENGKLSGYFGEIWNALEIAMNFSSEYLGKSFDSRGSDPWNLVIEDIRRRIIDVGLGDFISTNARIDFLDFSYPLFVSDLQVFYRILGKETFSHVFLFPFENEIWAAVALWWILIALTFFAFNFFRRRLTKVSSQVIFPSSFFLTFRALCGQSSPETPVRLSERILFFLTYSVSAVLIPSYSASLTNYLTSEISTPSFFSLLDFYVTDTHKMTLVQGSFEQSFFTLGFWFQEEGNINPYEQSLYEKHLKDHELPKSYNEAFHKVCRDSQTAVFAISTNFYWETNKVENRKLREECLLGKLTQNVGVTVSSIILPKRSWFKGLIDHHLKVFQSAGIIARLRRKYWVDYKKPKNKLWRAVTMKESFDVFHILFVAAFLSFGFLIFERKRKREINKKLAARRAQLRLMPKWRRRHYIRNTIQN